jgi:hypothetical protein
MVFLGDARRSIAEPDRMPGRPAIALRLQSKQQQRGDMDPTELEAAVELHGQNINGLMENQLALTAQVQVLQAALAAVLLNHPDRASLLAAFQKYMKICKESAPRLAGRMEALEGGMLALLGQHQA